VAQGLRNRLGDYFPDAAGRSSIRRGGGAGRNRGKETKYQADGGEDA